MLEGIKEEVFAKASHAYGKASDVPAFLRGLLGKSEKARAESLFKLSSAICHQGTLYTATALAVPHLLELVASPKVKGRAGILRLLADIVTLDDHERFFIGGYPDAVPSDLPAAFKKAIVAVRKGSDAIVGLLADKDAEVRSAAAFLLAWLPKENAPKVADALAKEKDDAATVSLVLALGFLGAEAPALRAKSAVVKTAAALAMATVRNGKIDDAAQTLIMAAARKKTMKVEGMLFGGGDLAPFAVQVLAALQVFDALTAAVEADGAGAMFAANVVVRKIFEVQGKAPVPKHGAERRDQEEARLLAELPVKVDKLDMLQRRFVNALTEVSGGFDNALAKALGERGLPSSKDLMKKWLAGPTEVRATILDRPASFNGKKTTLGDLYVKATVEKGEPKADVIDAIEASTSGADERMELARKGLEVVEVPWSMAVALELIWRSAPKASKASMAALQKLATKGYMDSVAVGVAHASRALAAGKAPDEAVDKLLQNAHEYWPIVKRALAALPIPRREKWLLASKRDDRAQPAEYFAGAWHYFDACPTKTIADRALAHVATWKPKDPWGGDRKKLADPVLKALADAFRAAGNEADAKRLDEAYGKLKK